MKYPIECLLIVLLQSVLLVIESEAGPSEKILLHHLLDKYNTLERPTENDSDGLTVKLGATLFSILNVDATNGVLDTHTWLNMKWVDSNLKWNISEFGNISDLRIPTHRIWTPDIFTYNSAHPDFDSTYPTQVVVKSDGKVTYIPPGIFRTTCAFRDFTWFPFDEHKCDMKFGSWVHSGDTLDLEIQDETGGDISNYSPNPEWTLLGMPARKNTNMYACCPEPYVDIVFTLHIKRNGSTYFVRDTIVSIFISSLIIIGFLVPAESGQKLTIGLVNLISSVVYLLYLGNSSSLPLGASPRILQYLQLQLFVVFASLIANVIVVQSHKRSPVMRPVPHWVNKVLIKKIAPLLGVSRPSQPNTNFVRTELDNLPSPIASSASGTEDLRELLLSEFQVLKTSLTQNQITNRDIIQDWKFAGNIIDRVFLIVFAVLISLFYICFFISFA